jgi:hypothetical protein
MSRGKVVVNLNLRTGWSQPAHFYTLLWYTFHVEVREKAIL